MAFTPSQAAWRRRAEQWAERHPLLPCDGCAGQALYLPEEDDSPELIWHCVACGRERVWSPPPITIPRYTHLQLPIDLDRLPRRTVLGVRTRLAQGHPALGIAREFHIQRQVVTAIRKAWEAEDDDQRVS